jgi:hypothetical protein
MIRLEVYPVWQQHQTKEIRRKDKITRDYPDMSTNSRKQEMQDSKKN